METKESKRPHFVVPILPLMVVVGLFTLLFVACRPSPGPDLEGTLVEQIAFEPFFMPVDGQGSLDEPKTTADLQGKVTFISFWATWCSPCQRELPYLGAIADRFEPDPDVQVWTVLLENQAGERTKETIAALFDRAEVSLPVYIPSGPLEPRSLVPQGIPAALLIGPDGKVAGAWTGYNPNLESEVVKLVAELQEAKKAGGAKGAEVAGISCNETDRSTACCAVACSCTKPFDPTVATRNRLVRAHAMGSLLR